MRQTEATPDELRHWIGFIDAGGGGNLSLADWDFVNVCRIALDEQKPLSEAEIAQLHRLYTEKSF